MGKTPNEPVHAAINQTLTHSAWGTDLVVVVAFI